MYYYILSYLTLYSSSVIAGIETVFRHEFPLQHSMSFLVNSLLRVKDFNENGGLWTLFLCVDMLMPFRLIGHILPGESCKPLRFFILKKLKIQKHRWYQSNNHQDHKLPPLIGRFITKIKNVMIPNNVFSMINKRCDHVYWLILTLTSSSSSYQTTPRLCRQRTN